MIGGSQTQSLLTVGKCKDSFCMHVDRAVSGPVLETYAGFAGKWLISVTTIVSQTIRPSNGESSRTMELQPTRSTCLC